MHFPDAYRAQYFLQELESNRNCLTQQFQNCSLFVRGIERAIQPFIAQLANELDQIILPTIVHEIHKEKLNLIGSTPEKKYTSFFVLNREYASTALDVMHKYPFLFILINRVIHHSFQNLRTCISRLKKEYPKLIKSCFFQHSHVLTIKMLTESDRHRGQQSLLITFANQQKIIYKPVDLRTDKLLSDFIQELDLPYPFNLKSMEIFPSQNYGWIRFIKRKSCNHLQQIRDFYNRTGALLAVAEALHFTDGHCENFLANGAYPILLDGESLFQNYTGENGRENKNILSTMMIQKVTEPKGYFNSALQAPIEIKYEGFRTIPIRDHTDEIHLRYVDCFPKSAHHFPKIHQQGYAAYRFQKELIQGYSFCYDQISKKQNMLLELTDWWEEVSQVHSRVVLRETAGYFYLLKCILMPEHVVSEEFTANFLQKKLGKGPYTDYEVSDLLKMNIPYFYHKVGEKNLFDGNGNVYPSVFSRSAITGMQESLLQRSDSKKLFNCEIIRKHVIPVQRKERISPNPLVKY